MGAHLPEKTFGVRVKLWGVPASTDTVVWLSLAVGAWVSDLSLGARIACLLQ